MFVSKSVCQKWGNKSTSEPDIRERSGNINVLIGILCVKG